MPKTFRVAGAALLLVAVAATGCGAAELRQTSPTARERANAERAAAVESARASFLAAKAAGGEYADPYRYYMAKEYLDLAEHELNGGDTKGVIDLAEKSKIHSSALVGKSGGGKK
ncbi:MAG: hypothetical protein C4529_00660 [Deltaproteobacteria bacterium]|nr:MAG: hypothetical protein C4529_00660 [Deltaproteobacteria bacterium]